MSEALVADRGAELLARRFHDTYERLAPSFGYETRPDTKAFDPTSANGRLMIAVCAAVAGDLAADNAALRTERDAQKRRGDNHWETLRSIRQIARESGDIERIVLWVNDAGSGYTETAEQTLAGMTDRARAAEKEREAATARAATLAEEVEKLREALKLGLQIRGMLAAAQEPPRDE